MPLGSEREPVSVTLGSARSGEPPMAAGSSRFAARLTKVTARLVGFAARHGLAACGSPERAESEPGRLVTITGQNPACVNASIDIRQQARVAVGGGVRCTACTQRRTKSALHRNWPSRNSRAVHKVRGPSGHTCVPKELKEFALGQ